MREDEERLPDWLDGDRVLELENELIDGGMGYWPRPQYLLALAILRQSLNLHRRWTPQTTLFELVAPRRGLSRLTIERAERAMIKLKRIHRRGVEGALGSQSQYEYAMALPLTEAPSHAIHEERETLPAPQDPPEIPAPADQGRGKHSRPSELGLVVLLPYLF